MLVKLTPEVGTSCQRFDRLLHQVQHSENILLILEQKKLKLFAYLTGGRFKSNFVLKTLGQKETFL
jgi:hypothetical protein